MKLLLDECVNQKFRVHLPDHDVSTVGYLGWDGLKNGVLLRTAADAGFDAMITTDRAMPSQHNTALVPLTVFVLHPKSDQLNALIDLVPALEVALAQKNGKRSWTCDNS